MGQRVLDTLMLQMGNYDYGKKKTPALPEPVIMKTESVKELESPTYLW